MNELRQYLKSNFMIVKAKPNRGKRFVKFTQHGKVIGGFFSSKGYGFIK